MKILKPILSLLIVMNASLLSGQDEETIRVYPQSYERALRNPMKGFTTRGVYNHKWASTAHIYLRWNQLENHESDGIEKIIKISNDKFGNLASRNIKVIPRVYLHWSGDEKYWPADMENDDYTSKQFQERVLRLIERLGICWDNDPRVAFVEMGIFGKWGEQHSPFPTPEMEKLVGDAFAEAFKNKKVSVRRNWERFTDHPYGEYWDSWAHYEQMWPHGNSIKQLNDQGRHLETYIGGEVAYGWGMYDIQPGSSPTETVSDPYHRDFMINSIRWLHCTQLRWIDDYDQFDPDAIAGAEEIQKAFGYRYEIEEVRFSLSDSLSVSFDVTNTGSAPFYYDWPVEIALLDMNTLEPVWNTTLENADIRDWHPGSGWTDPEWTPSNNWSDYHPDPNWTESGITGWSTPPAVTTISDKFKIDTLDGTYILSLAILDPAGDVPSLRFATANYLNGGRHPVGLVSFAENNCSPLPGDFQFDDPYTDQSLFYDDEFEIDYVPDPVQKSFNGNPWQFPIDTVQAWQYDYMFYENGDKYFALDSANTIGIYGCNDNSGFNIRSYMDSDQHEDAAQFLWDQTAETFQKNGQWLEYTTDFKINQPYQLLLRARTGKNARFRINISTLLGNVIYTKEVNVDTDFEILGSANGNTDWLLSKFASPELWGQYIIRFDWNDNIGEPGVFGSFSFLKSTFDVTPPEWYFVNIGTFTVGADIQVSTKEDGIVYLVPTGTPGDTASIKAAALTETEVISYNITNVSTEDLSPGTYVFYAVDASGNVSEASRQITLEKDDTQVFTNFSDTKENISVNYFPLEKSIKVSGRERLNKIMIYDILGNLQGIQDINDNEYTYNFSSSVKGIYVVRVIDISGNIKTVRIINK